HKWQSNFIKIYPHANGTCRGHVIDGQAAAAPGLFGDSCPGVPSPLPGFVAPGYQHYAADRGILKPIATNEIN
ncbi:MAG TPA: hypothetical protein VHO03_10275, partial [Ignavibacteriales bacterium]|nr:hypothetical protein [Ignavibacteriales bacterium]